MLGGCASVKEMLEHYSRLEEKNAAMVAQIAEDNLKIEKLEAKIDQLKKFMLNSFTEERDVNENTHLRDYEVTKNGLFNEQEIEAEDMAIIRKLADELHIPHEKENSYNLLLSIAERISAFERKIEGSRVKGTKTTEDGEQVEQLLERMDRFQESERLLDKTSFQQEYFRELCKSKRHQRSRK